MGVLDPKIDKSRTFELLRKRGVVKAVLPFSGGHDEGQVHSIQLELANGEETQLEVWYCGGYTMEGDRPPYKWVPLSKPETEDEELSDLLQGPIDERFGSWGGSPSTEGELVWDVATGEVSMQVSQETWEDDHVVF